MSIKTRFINKTSMKKVNEALRTAGYSEYPGDSTTAHPNGQGSGYVSNLLQYMAPNSDSERAQIERIVAGVIGN